MKHLLVIALVTLVACGKSKSECKAQADELTALLSQAETGGTVVNFDERDGLVTRTDLQQRPVHLAPIVVLRPTEVIYQGSVVTSDDELRKRLSEAHEQVKASLWRRDRPDPRHVYFLIHADTPWSRVVEAVTVADQAGMQAPMFVFAHPDAPKPPPRSSVDAKLDALRDEQTSGTKATTLANMMSAQIEKCPALQRAMGELGSDEGKPKHQLLVEKLGPALVECECNVRYPELRSILWFLLVNQKPARVVITDPGAPDEERIAFPPTTTWAEASKRLSATTTGIELAVQ